MRGLLSIRLSDPVAVSDAKVAEFNSRGYLSPVKKVTRKRLAEAIEAFIADHLP